VLQGIASKSRGCKVGLAWESTTVPPGLWSWPG